MIDIPLLYQVLVSFLISCLRVLVGGSVFNGIFWSTMLWSGLKYPLETVSFPKSKIDGQVLACYSYSLMCSIHHKMLLRMHPEEKEMKQRRRGKNDSEILLERDLLRIKSQWQTANKLGARMVFPSVLKQRTSCFSTLSLHHLRLRAKRALTCMFCIKPFWLSTHIVC